MPAQLVKHATPQTAVSDNLVNPVQMCFILPVLTVAGQRPASCWLAHHLYARFDLSRVLLTDLTGQPCFLIGTGCFHRPIIISMRVLAMHGSMTKAVTTSRAASTRQARQTPTARSYPTQEHHKHLFSRVTAGLCTGQQVRLRVRRFAFPWRSSVLALP